MQSRPTNNLVQSIDKVSANIDHLCTKLSITLVQNIDTLSAKSFKKMNITFIEIQEK